MSQPIYKIEAGDVDITSLVRDNFISLSITDEAGFESDSVEIRLDDRDNTLVLPPRGVVLTVSIGYKSEGLQPMGQFVVDETEVFGPPDTLLIRGRAADWSKSQKSSKTRSWNEVTVGAIVKTIAAEQNLEPAVAGVLADIAIPHIDQTAESDWHFLTRLARSHGAVVKPVMGRLLFVPSGTAKSASGKTLAAVTVPRKQTEDYHATFVEKSKYGRVEAYWDDTDDGIRRVVEIGEGGDVYAIQKTYPSEAEAKSAARAKHQALSRGVGSLSLSLEGNPDINAETPLNLTGYRQGVDGEWTAVRVVQTIGGGGFKTQLDAEIPT